MPESLTVVLKGGVSEEYPEGFPHNVFIIKVPDKSYSTTIDTEDPDKKYIYSLNYLTTSKVIRH